jgi:hypothetical protein
LTKGLTSSLRVGGSKLSMIVAECWSSKAEGGGARRRWALFAMVFVIEDAAIVHR